MERFFVPGSRMAMQRLRTGPCFGAWKPWGAWDGQSQCTGHTGHTGHAEPGQESFASYSWLIRGRLGLEPLLRAELQQMQRSQPLPGHGSVILGSAPCTRRAFESPEGLEAEGLVEVLGPWDVLYWTLGCRLAQSIWVRVGEPFDCETPQALEEALQEVPWDHFVGPNQLLRTVAWERESRLNAGELLSALAAARRAERAEPHAGGPESSLCLRAVLFRNRCSLELLCASRLGLREVHRSAERAERAERRAERPPTAPAAWTLASAINKSSEAESARKAPDLDGTFVAALVSQLQLSDGMVVWDPFCGNGQVLLELLSATLQLPPVKAMDRLPCSKLRPALQVEEVRTPESSSPPRAPQGLTLVGSDRSISVIQEARKRLLHFCDFYRLELQKLQRKLRNRKAEPQAMLQATPQAMPRLLHGPTILETQPPRPAAESSQRRSKKALKPDTSLGEGERSTESTASTFSSSEEGLPLDLEVSLNACSFEEIAPFLCGCVIVTRVPSEARGLGPTARTALLYRRFGSFLAGRQMLKGAYVLSDSPVFRRQTGLQWQSLCRFRGASGRVWQLLHWAPWAKGLPKGAKATEEKSPSGSDLQPERRPRNRSWERAPRRGQRKPRFFPRTGHEHNT
ncbi:rtcB [Symbiodinium sp. CCMP2592]|nr:rtcB [Symbiodinium sp. CCMP2592]